jgi:hypothetical protein
MTGFDRLKEQVKDQKDKALVQTVDYLLSREDMEQRYLNEEKNIEEMAKFIRNKARKYMKNGWNYITNEVVYAWAIMYFSLPNSFLKIEKKDTTKNKEKAEASIKKVTAKNNIVSLEDAKKNMNKKKETEQISLFGGALQ